MRPRGPPRLWPTNLAPLAGPVAPSTHSTAWHSGLHSPMRGRSAIIWYRRSGVALMTICSLSWVSHHRWFFGAIWFSLVVVGLR